MRYSADFLSVMVMTLWTRTVAFGVVKRISTRSLMTRPVLSIGTLSQAVRFRPSPLCMSTTSSTSAFTVHGISFVEQAVVDVLNDVFDPAEVARGAALAKLEKGKKKNKKGKKQNDEAAAEPELSDAEKQAIADRAAAEAKPFSFHDAMVTPATKAEFGDYQCNAAMGLAKSVGMNPR